MKTLKNILTKVKDFAYRRPLVTGVILFTGLVIGISAHADSRTLTHHSYSFFNPGYQNLCLSNNTTVTNGQYGLQVLGIVGTQWSNVVTLSTNTNSAASNTWPNLFVDVPIFPDYNGNVSTNYTITLVIGGTNAIATANDNIIQPTNYTPTNCVIPTAASTNVITVVIYKVPTIEYGGDLFGSGFSLLSTTTDSFTFATPATLGLTPCIYTTNLPASLIYGAAKLRCYSVAGNSNATSPGLIVNQIFITGWGVQ